MEEKQTIPEEIKEKMESRLSSILHFSCPICGDDGINQVKLWSHLSECLHYLSIYSRRINTTAFPSPSKKQKVEVVELDFPLPKGYYNNSSKQEKEKENEKKENKSCDLESCQAKQKGHHVDRSIYVSSGNGNPIHFCK